MRRKRGELVPLEVSILAAGLDLHAAGAAVFHGYILARALGEGGRSGFLTAHGTLYKALERLELAGLVASTWEDPMAAAEENRPRRRLYRVTPAGERALVGAAKRASTAPRLVVRPGEP